MNSLGVSCNFIGLSVSATELQPFAVYFATIKLVCGGERSVSVFPFSELL
jgi:hypothetical protein